MVEVNAIRLRCDLRILSAESRVERRIFFELYGHEVERIGWPDDDPVHQARRILQRLSPVLARTLIDDVAEIYAGVRDIELRCVDVLQDVPGVVVLGEKPDDRSLRAAGVVKLAVLYSDNARRANQHGLRENHPQEGDPADRLEAALRDAAHAIDQQGQKERGGHHHLRPVAHIVHVDVRVRGVGARYPDNGLPPVQGQNIEGEGDGKQQCGKRRGCEFLREHKPGYPHESEREEHHAYRLNGIGGVVAKRLPEVVVAEQLPHREFLGLLGLRRIEALLKVQGVSEYELVPEQPQGNPQAAEDAENDKVGTNVMPVLALQQADEDDAACDAREQGPAIVPGERGEKGADRHEDQLLQLSILHPAQEEIGRQSRGRETDRLAERNGLQVQHVRIQDKDQRAYEARAAAFRQPARGEEDADRRDDIARHRHKAAGEPTVPQVVVPDERPHQHVRQWEPDRSQLRQPRGQVVENASGNSHVRERVLVEQEFVLAEIVPARDDAGDARDDDRRDEPEIAHARPSGNSFSLLLPRGDRRQDHRANGFEGHRYRWDSARVIDFA